MATNLLELERRVDAIEKWLQTQIPQSPNTVAVKDWQKSVGLLQGNLPLMEVFESGQQLRESERRTAGPS